MTTEITRTPMSTHPSPADSVVHTDRCPDCNGPVEVWKADNSDGVTVNFACDNPKCPAGNGPWDTARPTTTEGNPQ